MPPRKRTPGKKLTQNIFLKSAGKCSITGKRLSFNNRKKGTGCWEQDHNKPFSKGGSTSYGNLSAVCTKINRKKSDMTTKQYIMKERKSNKQFRVRCQKIKKDGIQCTAMTRNGNCGRHK